MMTAESNCGGPSVWAAANPVHSSMKSDWTNSWALCQSFITLLYQQPPLPVLLEALKTMHISKAKSEGFLFVRLSVLCFEEVKRGNVLWLLFHCIWMKKKKERKKKEGTVCHLHLSPRCRKGSRLLNCSTSLKTQRWFGAKHMNTLSSLQRVYTGWTDVFSTRSTHSILRRRPKEI